MGGGASKQQLDVTAADRKALSASKETSYKGTQPLLSESPFTTGASGDEKFDDTDSPGKPVASATKLKRIALGQTTYMDQQRDYDQTLNKLDLNKTGVMDWIEPENGSPGKPNARAGITSPFQSPAADGKYGTPPGGGSVRVKKPPPPSGKPSPGAPSVHPTQQVVTAPNMTPSRVPPGPGRVMSPGGLADNHHPNDSPFGPPHTQPHPHSHSFSTPQKASTMQPAGPGHNQSGGQLLPRHNIHNQVASPSAVSGPPPTLGGGPPAGLVSRPFPGAGHQGLDTHGSDLDDSMIAEFGKSTRVVDSKKPDIVPTLSINAPKTTTSGRAMTASTGPSPIGRVNTGPNGAQAVPQVIPRAAPYTAPMYASGPSQFSQGQGQTQPGPNGMYMSNSQGHVGLPSSQQGTPVGGPGGVIQPMRNMGHSAGAAPPGVAPATSTTRPTGAPLPHGGGKLVAPVVKETKNVKRNRAQIPTQLAHALPTTGDWINKRYIVNNYILLEILGTGSYGEVPVRLC